MKASRRFHMLGNILHFHKFSSETNGRYCMVEALVAPGAGAPPNRHPEEEECFVVLEGSFDFMVEGEVTRAETGAMVTIPSGSLHAFSNAGQAPGRLMIFNAPGQIHDVFFSEAGDPVPEDSWDFPVTGGRPGVAHVLAAAAKAGVEIPPPPAEAASA